MKPIPTPLTDAFIGDQDGTYMTEGEIAMCEFARSLERKLNRFSDILENLIAEIDVPEPNCSCHLSPPCGDCVNFGHMRELIAEAKRERLASVPPPAPAGTPAPEINPIPPKAQSTRVRHPIPTEVAVCPKCNGPLDWQRDGDKIRIACIESRTWITEKWQPTIDKVTLWLSKLPSLGAAERPTPETH